MGNTATAEDLAVIDELRELHGLSPDDPRLQGGPGQDDEDDQDDDEGDDQDDDQDDDDGADGPEPEEMPQP